MQSAGCVCVCPRPLYGARQEDNNIEWMNEFGEWPAQYDPSVCYGELLRQTNK